MHTRKKILVFSDWFLPGYKAGGPIRSLANLVYSLEFDFWIVTRITDHHSTLAYPGIDVGKWTQHRANVRVCYIEDSTMNTQFVKRVLQENSFDYLYFNSLFSPLFTLLPLRVARSLGLSKQCVLAPRGMLKPGALSIKSKKKRVFLFVSRLLGWFNDIRWHATNEQEILEIRKHYGKSADVFMAPNLASVIDSNSPPAHKETGELRLVSIARISAEKGIREALLFLKDAHLGANIECAFYGTQQDETYLEECIALSKEIQGARISFPGEIAPEQIEKALEQAHFFYMATWGENFGHAIAESLQYGKPAIVSNRTPWRGLTKHKAGWDLELESAAFVEILRVCHAMTQDEYNSWSSGAMAYGRAHANDPANLHTYYTLFQ